MEPAHWAEWFLITTSLTQRAVTLACYMLNVWVAFGNQSGPNMEPAHWAEWLLIGFDSALMRSKVQNISGYLLEGTGNFPVSAGPQNGPHQVS